MRAFFFLLLTTLTALAAEPSRSQNTVILDEAGVRNLRLKTEVVERTEFEETVFALGRIAVFPGHRAVVSSRIAGRASEVFSQHDHPVKKGDVAVIVESRQPGDPPPMVKLLAPISGLVSTTNIAPGEPVEPDKILGEILDISKVYALARVPEHFAGKLAAGQSARIEVPAVAGKVFSARLEHLGVTADAESGTIEAAFEVENPELLLRPGMRAEFSIVVEKSGSVLAIPRSALQGDLADRFVYVRDFELPNAFVKTPVVVGRMTDRSVEILSGLFESDEVVTHGAYSLAFAGGGSLSLKEALDAAHGHEHAADGSELTDATPKGGAADHGHEHGGGGGGRFWMIVSGGLFVALVLVSLRRKGGAGA